MSSEDGQVLRSDPCLFYAPHRPAPAARPSCTRCDSKSHAVVTVRGRLWGPAPLKPRLQRYTPPSLGEVCSAGSLSHRQGTKVWSPRAPVWCRGWGPQLPFLLRHQREAEGLHPPEMSLRGQHGPGAPGGQGHAGLRQPRPGAKYVLRPARESPLHGHAGIPAPLWRCRVPVPRVPGWPWGAC